MTKGLIAKQLWDKLLYAYGQHGRTRINIPADDVLDILLALMANVVAGVGDPTERERMMRELAPRLDRLVTYQRSKPSLHIPSNAELLLPN